MPIEPVLESNEEPFDEPPQRSTPKPDYRPKPVSVRTPYASGRRQLTTRAPGTIVNASAILNLDVNRSKNVVPVNNGLSDYDSHETSNNNNRGPRGRQRARQRRRQRTTTTTTTTLAPADYSDEEDYYGK